MNPPRYLIKAGHRRIAFISTLRTEGLLRDGMQLDSSQISDRRDGMKRAFEEAGLDLPVDLVRLNAGEPNDQEDHPRAAAAPGPCDGDHRLRRPDRTQRGGGHPGARPLDPG